QDRDLRNPGRCATGYCNESRFFVALILGSLVSCLHLLGFGHVLAFFCGAVETRAFLVINMRISVNPNQAVSSARDGRFGCGLSGRAFRWGWGSRGGTGRCR